MGIPDVLLLQKDIEDLILLVDTLLKKSLTQSSKNSDVATDSICARFRKLKERYHFLESNCKALIPGEIDEPSLRSNEVSALLSYHTIDAVIAEEEPSDARKPTLSCEPSLNSPSSASIGLHTTHSVDLLRPVSIFPNPVSDNETNTAAFREAFLSAKGEGREQSLGSSLQSLVVQPPSTTAPMTSLSASGVPMEDSAHPDRCVYSFSHEVGVKPSAFDWEGSSEVILSDLSDDSVMWPASLSPLPALPASVLGLMNADKALRNRTLNDGLEEGAPRDMDTWKNAPPQVLLRRFVTLKAGSAWRRFQSLPIPELASFADALHPPPDYFRSHQYADPADPYGARVHSMPVYDEIRTSSDDDTSMRALQKHCAYCLTPLYAQSKFWCLVKFAFRGAARFCHYTNRYYCRACHKGEVLPIPSRLLWNWDATPFAVSNAVKNLWTRYQDKPLFAVGALNPSLYDKVPALHAAYALRVQINTLWGVCIQCAHFRRLFYGDVNADTWDSEAGVACYVPLAQRYYLEGTELWSFADLLELHRWCPRPLSLSNLPCFGEQSSLSLPRDRIEVGLKYFSNVSDEAQHEKLASALSHTKNADRLRQAQTDCHGNLRDSRNDSSRLDDNPEGFTTNSLASAGLLYSSCSVLQILHRIRQAMKWHLFQQRCGVRGFSRGCTACQRHAADVCRLCCPTDIAEDFLRTQVCGIEEGLEIQNQGQQYQGHEYEQCEMDTFAYGKERRGCGIPNHDCDRSFLSRLPKSVLPFFVLSIDVLHVHICPQCGAAYHKSCWQDSVSSGNSEPCMVCRILPISEAHQSSKANTESRS
ncbi:unnamed protein product [Phytomonas sp. Hart1]|nr:unnamed protein product [Phytomonas sp. Hart1]|eukprot:CCW69757.1 unnamed protein product [Phytomonas sp. isolate Hart1]